MHDEIGMADQIDSKLRLTHQAPPPPLRTLQSGGSIVNILPNALNGVTVGTSADLTQCSLTFVDYTRGPLSF